MTDQSPQLHAAHHAARMYADECRRGLMSRREFMTRATALGVGVPAAYGLLGLAAPKRAARDPTEEVRLRFLARRRMQHRHHPPVGKVLPRRRLVESSRVTLYADP